MDRDLISERIRGWIEGHKDESTTLASNLVRIPSVNHPPNGNEFAYQLFFANRLRSMGAIVSVYELDSVPGLREHPAFMSGRNYANRPNVHGMFPSKRGGRSLVFSGHADTVYEGVEPWQDGPFNGTIRDGKLFGRGSYDMKGGMAAALEAVRCLNECGIPLNGTVYIESVVDEEHGGANGTLAGRLMGINPDMAIIPEPTNLVPYSGHLGGGIWKAEFSGKSGIGFNGEVLLSALDATVSFAMLLQKFKRRLNEHVEPHALWSHTDRGIDVVVLSILSGDTKRELQEKLPADGKLNFWIEGYPGMTERQIIGMLQEFYESELPNFPILEKCRPQLTPLIRYLSGSEMGAGEQTDRFLDSVKRAGTIALEREPAPPQGAPFACDGFMFNLYSPTPALVLGPSGANAHAADEHMDLDSYTKLIRWYAEIMVDWCGVGGE
ncbi:N-formyl-4-amino-5-aminomethyl-2-methylpyrimidinedeformylase [Paenibacillus solanacearum]|uniref:N-formyl-4-amino-5-aminomethyl-2-methylpyrimidine deformylase n=1 Tax=Paenibacillus solanacearum TaxID=2048548 RepID=A0A916NL48_9BACL|nr:M20/M25/M40 family metallo-hydrolase [Paenibacillus solanacearum]CAG7646323.1 N-formyl-4-amino-5-aminomethyl-2-methylpyrimidinedeformylase [Paenibacillus solanacearum]